MKHDKIPAITVIMAVFNGAQYIREANESVLNQTFKDVESVVIDDGSTDDTKMFLEPWIKQGKIHYIYH